eukprot:GHVN01078457.1.p1 GENE.GHVN01078457.1~~GHVN01078457.1.p1  ORF type:complete len:658 (-),score=177.27 GHVN01078457.1:944-2848(-)
MSTNSPRLPRSPPSPINESHSQPMSSRPAVRSHNSAYSLSEARRHRSQASPVTSATSSINGNWPTHTQRSVKRQRRRRRVLHETFNGGERERSSDSQTVRHPIIGSERRTFTAASASFESLCSSSSSSRRSSISSTEEERERLHLGSSYGHHIDEFTWDPRNPLNTIGPHAGCHGSRCDHIFLPPLDLDVSHEFNTSDEDNQEGEDERSDDGSVSGDAVGVSGGVQQSRRQRLKRLSNHQTHSSSYSALHNDLSRMSSAANDVGGGDLLAGVTVSGDVVASGERGRTKSGDVELGLVSGDEDTTQASSDMVSSRSVAEAVLAGEGQGEANEERDDEASRGEHVSGARRSRRPHPAASPTRGRRSRHHILPLVPCKADIVFREPLVVVDGGCFGCIGQRMMVTLSDHYAVRVELRRDDSIRGSTEMITEVDPGANARDSSQVHRRTQPQPPSPLAGNAMRTSHSVELLAGERQDKFNSPRSNRPHSLGLPSPTHDPPHPSMTAVSLTSSAPHLTASHPTSAPAQLTSVASPTSTAPSILSAPLNSGAATKSTLTSGSPPLYFQPPDHIRSPTTSITLPQEMNSEHTHLPHLSSQSPLTTDTPESEACEVIVSQPNKARSDEQAISVGVVQSGSSQ